MKTSSQSRETQQQNKQDLWHTLFGFAAVFAVIAVLVYLAIAGRTDAWPESDCTVVGSRVVVADVERGTMRDPTVVYRGEYRIQYAVNGKQYFTWADAGWANTDRNTVKRNVENVTVNCPVRVRYNPKNPAENVTHALRP